MKLQTFYLIGNLSPEQRYNISQDTQTRLVQSATSMDRVLNDLMNGTITFDDFGYLYENKSKVLELCEVSSSFQDKTNLISDTFEERFQERKCYSQFHTLLSDLLSYCEDFIKGIS